MKESIRQRLDRVCERHDEIERLLSEPDTIADQERFRALSQEYAQTATLVREYERHRRLEEELTATRELLAEGDSEMRGLAEAEAEALETQCNESEARLLGLLVPRDPRDDADVYLEVRAGTGGDEAALFAGDLYRMYARYAEQRNWQIEILSAHEGEQGGFRELIARVSGRGVFARLKFESGAHRVQRVPETESQGRIHTSAATVAVLPVPEAIEAVEVNPSELRVDTYRASGAGGQHVNKTDSAVRLTHLPTGIVVECQDERSQHKNRAKAMALLQARLTAERKAAQVAEQEQTRRLQVGSGDRSERIRTYNFPQGRVTDHRINLTLYRLEEVLAGHLDLVIEPLLTEHHAEALAEISGGP